ncbi:MAG: sigma-54 dependent transcriptional regulator [Candidatus Hydrogenedentales bacterium]
MDEDETGENMHARILVIDDEDLMREYVEEALTRAGHEVDAASSGQAGLDLLAQKHHDLVVTDLKMAPVDGLHVVTHARDNAPDTRCIVMTAYGTIETAVEAMRRGAEDYILKPFSPDELEIAVQRVLEKRRLAAENRYLREAVNERYDFHAMVGESAAMAAVYAQVEKVASSRATVFIRGESGTGKELVARAIHHAGDRREKPFIKVNCAALSAGLLESELFGHEKGSFTGAHERKIGRFELADGGTLLLDEVSEIGPELQPKLLRALQEREIDRVGGTRSIPVDARIVATSNRNLEAAVADGKFREDLYFRLNVIPLHLPPLRERPEDIPMLIEHFVSRFARENGRTIKGLTAAARERLLRYTWPGNVRELQNCIERAVVLADGPQLDVHDLSLPDRPIGNGNGALQAGTTVAEMEKELIFKTLEHCDDNRTKAADLLGISVRTLRNKLKEYRETAVAHAN